MKSLLLVYKSGKKQNAIQSVKSNTTEIEPWAVVFHLTVDGEMLVPLMPIPVTKRNMFEETDR